MSLLGIDLGTSGLKCIAYDHDLKILSKNYMEHNLLTPVPGVVELDPSEVWDNLCMCIIRLCENQRIKKDPIEAIAISVSGDEALPIDKQGNPLYNTIMSMEKGDWQKTSKLMEKLV